MTFVVEIPVYFDELDLYGHLHNARYPVHVERACTAWGVSVPALGAGWTDGAPGHPDLHLVVRELRIEFLAPFRTPGPMPVELGASHLGTTSAVFAFRCGTVDLTWARGHRAVVKTDPATGRPAPWTDAFREAFARLGPLT